MSKRSDLAAINDELNALDWDPPLRAKPKRSKLTFRSHLKSRATPEDNFQAALRAADQVTIIESARMITFKLRKKRVRTGQNPRS